MILTYKYKLLHTKKQHAYLNMLLEEQRILYNAALQERIDCYKKTKKSISYFDQCKSLTEIRNEEIDNIPVNIQRWTLKRLDDSYKSFFRKNKGFPRFRSIKRWRSFGFAEWSGIRLKNSKLYIGKKRIRINMHRSLPENAVIKSCVFTKDNDCSICLQIQIPDVKQRDINTSIGIDVGISSLATLSNGTKISNQQVTKKYKKQLRVVQRSLARKKRGSNRRKKAIIELRKIYRKIKNTRDTYLHQISCDLVGRYDLIATEDLNIKGMVQSNLAKSIHDVSWSKLRQLLAYKAEGAGKRLIAVDPKYTSQTCSECGYIDKKNRNGSKFVCLGCGFECDADINASVNILNRAVASPEFDNVIQWDERRIGNINLKENSN